MTSPHRLKTFIQNPRKSSPSTLKTSLMPSPSGVKLLGT